MRNANIDRSRRPRPIDTLMSARADPAIVEHRTVPEAKMQAAPEPAIVLQPIPQPIPLTPPVAPAVTYYDMDDAPKDGKAVWLKSGEGVLVEGLFRHTRKWDKNGGKWRIIGYWAVRNAGGLAVPFKPIAWKPV